MKNNRIIDNIGISVKNTLDIDFFNSFQIGRCIEIKLNSFLSENYTKDDMKKYLLKYKDFIYSYHLLTGNDLPCKEYINQALISFKALFEEGIVEKGSKEIFVIHPCHFFDYTDMVNIFSEIGKFAEEYNNTIVIENMPDLSNKNPKSLTTNPRLIAEVLEIVNNPLLGLCIDTGHAICNCQRNNYHYNSMDWDNKAIHKWLKHMHIHDSIPEKDLHAPLSKNAFPNLISNIEFLLSNIENRILLILENSTYKEIEESYLYIKNLY